MVCDIERQLRHRSHKTYVCRPLEAPTDIRFKISTSKWISSEKFDMVSWFIHTYFLKIEYQGFTLWITLGEGGGGGICVAEVNMKFVWKTGMWANSRRDRPIRPKPDNQINKNHMTKYFLPYDQIKRQPDDQIYQPFVTLLRRAFINL